MTSRPGPLHVGPARVFVVRVVLLLTVSFLLAGSAIAALLSIGAHPIG